MPLFSVHYRYTSVRCFVLYFLLISCVSSLYILQTEDQPAVTEVTEVTSEEPAAAAEGESKPAEEAEVKKEEEKPKEKPKEEKKKEPKPKSKKPKVDYRTVKEGWIEKPGEG